MDIFKITFIYSLRKDNGVDKRDLKSDEQKKNIGVLTKLKQKISHPFTKTYISDSAHKLELHREKLLAELFAMETNPQLQEILVQYAYLFHSCSKLSNCVTLDHIRCNTRGNGRI